MQMSQVKRRIKSDPNATSAIISHAGSRLYVVHIYVDGEVHLLTNWRGRPRVFRSLDEAKQELHSQGLPCQGLSLSVPQDEVLGRQADQDPGFQGLSRAVIPLS